MYGTRAPLWRYTTLSTREHGDRNLAAFAGLRVEPCMYDSELLVLKQKKGKIP